MTGSPIYQIIQTTKFEKSFSKLRKKYKKSHGEKGRQEFIKFVEQLLSTLRSNPYSEVPKSRAEPLPAKVDLPENLRFRKLEFKMKPRLGGASGCGRLMYLVDSEQNRIILLWIYTHEEFSCGRDKQDSRPSDPELKPVIQDAIDSFNNN